MQHHPRPPHTATSTEAKTSVAVPWPRPQRRPLPPPTRTASSAATERHQSRPSSRPLPRRQRFPWPSRGLVSREVATGFRSSPAHGLVHNHMPSSMEATSTVAIPWPHPHWRPPIRLTPATNAAAATFSAVVRAATSTASSHASVPCRHVHAGTTPPARGRVHDAGPSPHRDSQERLQQPPLSRKRSRQQMERNST